VALLFVSLLFAFQAVSAQSSYYVTVVTDKSSYMAGQTIAISGSVHPAPGPSTAVFLRVFNPSGNTVAVGDAPVDATTGDYTFSLAAGGTSAWVTGAYTVNATWGAYPPTVYGTTVFTYAAAVATTTTSSTTSTSTSTTTHVSSTSTSVTTPEATSTITSIAAQPTTSITTSTATSFILSSFSSTSISTSSSPSTSTSTGGGGGIPEFPFEGLAVVFLGLVVVGAYYVARKSRESVRP